MPFYKFVQDAFNLNNNNIPIIVDPLLNYVKNINDIHENDTLFTYLKTTQNITTIKNMNLSVHNMNFKNTFQSELFQSHIEKSIIALDNAFFKSAEYNLFLQNNHHQNLLGLINTYKPDDQSLKNKLLTIKPLLWLMLKFKTKTLGPMNSENINLGLRKATALDKDEECNTFIKIAKLLGGNPETTGKSGYNAFYYLQKYHENTETYATKMNVLVQNY